MKMLNSVETYRNLLHPDSLCHRFKHTSFALDLNIYHETAPDGSKCILTFKEN